MTGSLQIKNDKYYVVLNTYDKNRKRKLKWIPTGLSQKGNKKRAEQFLRQCLNEYEANQCLAHDILTWILFAYTEFGTPWLR